jgi:membrane-bound lytic murein transglycosylase D
VAALSGSLDQFKADSKATFDTLQAEVAKIGSAKAKATTTNGKAAVAGNGEYIIAKGDLLGTIAKKLGTSVKSLQDLNPGINPNNLKVGSKIKTK